MVVPVVCGSSYGLNWTKGSFILRMKKIKIITQISILIHIYEKGLKSQPKLSTSVY